MIPLPPTRLPIVAESAREPAKQGVLTFPRCALFIIPIVLVIGCTGPREYVRNCFKVGPNYRRPPAAVADNWIDARDARVRREPVDDSHWWTVFNDPALSRLVQTAYQQNLTLRQAAFRVLQARARLAIAAGNLFPQTQQAFGDYQHEALSRTVANREFVRKPYFDVYDAGFNLTWELDLWGRLRRTTISMLRWRIMMPSW